MVLYSHFYFCEPKFKRTLKVTLLKVFYTVLAIERCINGIFLSRPALQIILQNFLLTSEKWIYLFVFKTARKSFGFLSLYLYPGC